MAASSERPPEGTWSDLETSFFAGAPPDVPEPPPEPMRFDDLDPLPPPRRERRVRLRRSRDRSLATRSSVRVAFTRMGRRASPAVAWTREKVARLSVIAWRRLVRALVVVGDAGVREGRRAAARFRAGLPSGFADRPAIVAVASLVIVTGLSAVVVASRGAVHAPLPTTTMAVADPIGLGGPAACDAPAISELPADLAPAPAPPLRAGAAGAAKPSPVVVKPRPHKRVVAAATGTRAAQLKAGKPSPSAKPVAFSRPLPPAPVKAAAPAPAKPLAPAPARAFAPVRPAPVPPAPAAAAPAPARRPIFSRWTSHKRLLESELTASGSIVLKKN